jgi:medium-chain acyl-[acyl-carrier-protein] hydrolase
LRKVKLICIPHAGGLAAAYLKWKPYLHPSIELVPVELAGKGRRFSQPLYESVGEAVNDILSVVRENIANSSYALYGHSMGAMLAFELLHALRAAGLELPVCSFFSAKNPPHRVQDKLRHLLSNEELWDEVRGMGGTPEELFANPELRELFFPVLRRDFKLVDTYEVVPGRDALNCPFVVLYGQGDSLTPAETLMEWAKYSSCKTTLHGFDGGHFFVFDRAEEVAELVNQYLLSYGSYST